MHHHPAIHHPEYYGGADDPYEAIKVIDAWQLNFSLGCVLKYLKRAGSKRESLAIEDLEKAAWYLHHEMARRQGETLPEVDDAVPTPVTPQPPRPKRPAAQGKVPQRAPLLDAIVGILQESPETRSLHAITTAVQAAHPEHYAEISFTALRKRIWSQLRTHPEHFVNPSYGQWGFHRVPTHTPAADPRSDPDILRLQTLRMNPCIPEQTREALSTLYTLTSQPANGITLTAEQRQAIQAVATKYGEDDGCTTERSP